MIKNLDIASQIIFSRKIYSFLFMLNLEYPNFNKWYKSLFNNNILNEDREIILCTVDSDIAGVIILKRDKYENKICTLRVSPIYQGLGIGSTLLEKSFDYFNDDKPLITIHISKYHEFRKLFEKYGFTLEQQAQGYYGLLRSELSYNGLLTSPFVKNPTLFEQVVFKIEKSIYNYPSFDSKIYIVNQIKSSSSIMTI